MLRALLLLLLVACGEPTRPLGPDAADAGPGATCTSDGPTAPPCCGQAGNRLRAADCVDGAWTCAEGAACECQGVPATFICTDTCGSDAFIDPTCSEEGWTCRGMQRTSDCPAGTCWGYPGDCCVAPACVDGRWQCESILDPCL